jgi:O-antigen/teichoic acid export membrane protein
VDAVVSVGVAFLTDSASAFVWGLIASAILEVILSFILIPLHPKFSFEPSKVKLVISRGLWVNLTGIFSYFADNGDNIAVGKILGASSLGIYQVAYKFSTLPISEIANVVNQVIFPVLSKFSDDKERLRKAFFRMTAVNSVGAVSLGLPIFLLAGPIILIFMGEQWLSAVPIIRILAVYGIIRTVFGSFSALFLSVGKQEYVAKMLFVRFLGLLIFVVPLVSIFSMEGAAYAMLISCIVEIPVIIYFTVKVLGKS